MWMISRCVLDLPDNAGDAQRSANWEQKKTDGKGLFLIHSSVDPNIFEKIVYQETTKGVWDTLNKA